MSEHPTAARPAVQCRLARAEALALIAALVGVIAMIIAALIDPARFIQGYLVGYLYWLAMPFGAISLLMLHHLVGGRWGAILRRPLEAGALTFGLMALFFVPIMLQLSALFPWARATVVAEHPELEHKSLYLNIEFFIGRAALYFFVWILLAWLLDLSGRRESAGAYGARRRAEQRRLQRISALGLLAVFFTSSFAAVDWAQSLEPLWSSAEYPMLFLVGQALSAAAFFIVTIILLARSGPLSAYLKPQILNDLGNILLVFVVLWAYVEFMQFLIIWSGDLHDEIPWYLTRGRGGWGALIAALALFQFLVPLFLLFFKKIKRAPHRLLWLALMLLCTRFIDLYWLIIPAFYPDGFAFIWPALAALLGIGGVWVWAFCRLLRRAPFMAARSVEIFRVAEGTPVGDEHKTHREARDEH